MAEIIFEGGKNPMTINTWQDEVKLTILESLYHYGLNLEDMRNRLYREPYYSWFTKRHERRLAQEEVRVIIVDMFREGSIEGWQYKCECCKNTQIAPEKILDHVTGFRLTAKGRDLIPEHIFP
jgi:hypothetical protein